MNPPNYLLYLSERTYRSKKKKKSTTKGPPHSTSRHITTNKSTIVSESQGKNGRYRQSWTLHTRTVRFTVLLIIMGVETPRWKKHQGLSDGLNCICTVGWVSVHVNPCHVITSRSAANSVEATTCVAVQLRRNTIDLTKLYYGRSPHLLSAVGMLGITCIYDL